MSVLAQYLGNGLVTGATYALAALGLTLIFGHMDLVNFAHGAVYMLGAFLAYTAVVLAGMPFFVGLVVAVAAVMLFAAILERAVFRPIRRVEAFYMPMLATIALAVILPNAAILIWNPTPKRLESPIGGESLDLGLLHLAPQQILVIGAVAVAIVAVHLFFSRSRMGTQMRAAFQDPVAAWLGGIDVNRVYVLAFAIGSGLAALAGVLISTIVLITPAIGNFIALKAFVVVILGGIRSFAGAVVGGLLLGVSESLAAGYISTSYKDGVGLLMLVLVLTLLPGGLFGAKRTVEA
jgi:branched-chain amino acid transport system permease protein